MEDLEHQKRQCLDEINEVRSRAMKNEILKRLN
jgi:hypothetical protein